MEVENVKEYEFTRRETELVRDCITTYMGFVVGGSGAAMFGLAALRVFGADNKVVVSHVAFATSIIVALVLALLFYKFNSHNRYAAYSRALADEAYQPLPERKGVHESKHVAWELCIERIRTADRFPELFREQVRALAYYKAMDAQKVQAINWVLANYVGHPGKNPPPVDVNKVRGGVAHLWLALRGRTNTTSWAFPPSVVAIFFVLTSIYLAIGVYGTLTVAFESWDSQRPFGAPLFILAIVSLAVLVAQASIWKVLCGKLCTLLSGSATVDGFSFRFALVRAMYLQRFGLVPEYSGIENLMIEAFRAHAQSAATDAETTS